MKMELRDYQIDAVQKTYDYLREKKSNPCIVIPTGGGKTPVIARLCADVLKWNGRVLVLTHVKELVRQNYETFIGMNSALMLHCGINSAGLGSRDTDARILFA